MKKPEAWIMCRDDNFEQVLLLLLHIQLLANRSTYVVIIQYHV